ncbi:MAG: homocysteine S-methyltransferase family protein [Actinomycetota bacterium]
MSNLLDALADGPILSDGAMGTMLQDLGNTEGGAPELWNVEHAEVVEGVLEGYAAAGSRLLTTNTFGGTRARLQMHGLEDRVVELNQAAAALARRVANRHPGVFVLGDIGPSGELMEPMGDLTPESAQELFAEQIRGLVAGGTDAILIETMSDLSEIEAAVMAAKAEAPGLPIITTLSFDTNLRTMMGVSPALAVTTLAGLGVDIIGANCGRGLDEMRIIAAQLAEARVDGVLLIVQSNAGLPKLVGDSFEFDGTPEEMAAYAVEMRGLGIDIIGACCGSTPAHIEAMRVALAG